MSSPGLQLLTVFCNSAKGTSSDAGPPSPGLFKADAGGGIKVRGGERDPAIGVPLHEEAAQDGQRRASADDFARPIKPVSIRRRASVIGFIEFLSSLDVETKRPAGRKCRAGRVGRFGSKEP